MIFVGLDGGQVHGLVERAAGGRRRRRARRRRAPPSVGTPSSTTRRVSIVATSRSGPNGSMARRGRSCRGSCTPRSPEGGASIVPPPPWHYSGDVLTLEYRTDPGVRWPRWLPEGVEPADEDPDAVAVIWADWQIVLGLGRGAARPRALAVQGVLRRRALPLRGRDVLAGACTSGSTRTSRSPAAGTRGIRRSSARSG